MKIPTNYKAQLGEAADFLLDKSWLERYYPALSTRQIGALVGCGKKAVVSALKRHNIPINYRPRDIKKSNLDKFVRSVSIEAIGKLNNKDWLYDAYIIQNKSRTELASELGVSSKCVGDWLRKFAITKSKKLRLECSARRYKESQGFDMSSEQACKKRMRGRRGCRLETKKGGAFWCHSSWEKDVALFLDNDNRVLTFSKDSIKIEYLHDEKKRIYYPDFMIKLVDKILIVEVKAARLLNDDRVQAKLRALYQYCEAMCFVAIVLTGTTSVDPTKIFEEE